VRVVGWGLGDGYCDGFRVAEFPVDFLVECEEIILMIKPKLNLWSILRKKV
jgi:hypothetical protein